MPMRTELICADYSAIEARGIAWLAGQDDVLDSYRVIDADKSQPDAYCQAAAGMFGRPITKHDKLERAGGKVLVLAGGFGGGVGAIYRFAKVYNVDMASLYDTLCGLATDEQLEKAKAACYDNLARYPGMTDLYYIAADIAKQRWRAVNLMIVQYWYDCQMAAISAVKDPGTIFPAGPDARAVRYKKSGSFLWARLPSGRYLCYPYPEIHENKVPWGGTRPALSFMGVDALTKVWKRETTFGGRLAENNTQAICRDILSAGLLRLNRRGYPVVMHVHDEPVCEVPFGTGSVEEMCAIMCEPLPWATGLPLRAEGWRGHRYRKE